MASFTTQLVSRTTGTFQSLLAPILPFDSAALPNISALDVLGALRLSVVLRQIRRRTAAATGVSPSSQGSLWWHDLVMTMLIVFGGEVIASSFLAVSPSFMFSPTVTLLFVASHTLANALPSFVIPDLGLQTELPISLFDGATRSMLVCDYVHALITKNPNPLIRQSPMAVLVTSTFLANGGFFFVNLLNMLGPTGTWSLTAPPELGPYGWTTTDLWIAPLTSALFFTLTQAQPFWVDLQRTILSALGDHLEVDFTGSGAIGIKAAGAVIQPMKLEDARSVCAILLGAAFAARAVKNFGPAAAKPMLPAAPMADGPLLIGEEKSQEVLIESSAPPSKIPSKKRGTSAIKKEE